MSGEQTKVFELVFLFVHIYVFNLKLISKLALVSTPFSNVQIFVFKNSCPLFVQHSCISVPTCDNSCSVKIDHDNLDQRMARATKFLSLSLFTGTHVIPSPSVVGRAYFFFFAHSFLLQFYSIVFHPMIFLAHLRQGHKMLGRTCNWACCIAHSRGVLSSNVIMYPPLILKP